LKPERSFSSVVWVVGLCLWLAVGALLFSRGMVRSLNHDEHQFLAPGALLSREGLLPYRDYPLFHLPNLVFAYAAMDRLTGDPILGPKLLSFLASWLGAGIILWVALRYTQGSAWVRLTVGASLLVLLHFDPLFLYTAGKTWNHEVPALLLLLAILFHVESFRRNSTRFIALSGLACGLAIGTRLTFLPCIIPLLGTIILFPVEPRRRWTLAAAFSGGAAISMAPSLYFLATSPEPFLFGNLEFPRLRLLDPENTRIRKTMTLWRKLRYFAKEIVLPSWPAFVAFIAFAVPAFRRRLGGLTSDRDLHLVPLVGLFLVAGCFLPSRYQYQHFFALLPLVALGIALARIGSTETSPRCRYAGVSLLALLALISFGRATYLAEKGDQPALPQLSALHSRADWFSTEAIEFGEELRSHVPSGRILTLAPAGPLAAGLQIYPEFATGPFAWRSAKFVAPARRSPLHVVAPDDLETFLTAAPPAGILTGVEDDDLEEPLIAYAENHGFHAIKLQRKRKLWVPRGGVN
jgi:hypothetical protein